MRRSRRRAPSTSAASGLERWRPAAATVVFDGRDATLVIEQRWGNQAAFILLFVWFTCGLVPVTAFGAYQGYVDNDAVHTTVCALNCVAWLYALAVAIVNRTRVCVHGTSVVRTRGPLPWLVGLPRRTVERGDVMNVVRQTRRTLRHDG